jgi:hypothetical protein
VREAFVRTEKRREKVVVLRELQRAIIYTRELSKQVTESHVSTAFIAYLVDEVTRLTAFIYSVKAFNLCPYVSQGKSMPT